MESDLAVEIVSPSSKRMDYAIKLFKYRTYGVREYWIVDPEKKRIRYSDKTSRRITALMIEGSQVR